MASSQTTPNTHQQQHSLCTSLFQTNKVMTKLVLVFPCCFTSFYLNLSIIVMVENRIIKRQNIINKTRKTIFTLCFLTTFTAYPIIIISNRTNYLRGLRVVHCTNAHIFIVVMMNYVYYERSYLSLFYDTGVFLICLELWKP